MTVEYTALADPDYRSQVIAGFDRRVAADLAIRLSADRPDQWYQLHNPEELDQPYAISFETERGVPRQPRGTPGRPRGPGGGAQRRRDRSDRD